MWGDWLTSIDHADAADWITVLAYLIAGLLCARAAAVARLRRQNRERWFWRTTAWLLVFFAINELLDLQTLLTFLGRANAKANGWYEQRRAVQFYFLVALASAAVLSGGFAIWMTRRLEGAVRVAVLGLGFIALFVLVRAASFHHVDALLGRGWRYFNWGSVQEMSGILIVCAAAARYARMQRQKTDRNRPRDCQRCGHVIPR